ncbi:MAG: hypothetical protein E2O74_05525 [Chloroflexi bacterium]|nr:hypothetical protein [Chloroflexota bacterium]TDI84157.1 MAG: hypothetical protein E2O74_05525 [Chloroflexota bacterium]
MSEEVVYVSNIRVERIKGPYRRVYMPVEEDPIYLSTHSEIAEYYKHEPGVHPIHSSTLDYLVAAAAG